MAWEETAMTTDSEQRAETWKAARACPTMGVRLAGPPRGHWQVLAAGWAPRLPGAEAGPQQREVGRPGPSRSVMRTFEGPCPPARNLAQRARPARRWPEDMRYGTKPENHADQVAAGTARRPRRVHHPVRWDDRKQGSRCLPCAAEVGEQAAAMLSAGMGLEAVTRASATPAPIGSTSWPPGTAATASRLRRPGPRAADPRNGLRRFRYRLKGYGKSSPRRSFRSATPDGQSPRDNGPQGNGPGKAADSAGRSPAPLSRDNWDISGAPGTTLRTSRRT